MKIAFFGLGGVGGYMAAQMGDFYKDRNDIEFYYIARGEHLAAIKKSGLTLITDSDKTVTVHPTLATDNAKDCPKMDYVIYATKSYSIDSNIEQISELCDSNTTLITFMNGVDGYPKLRNALPFMDIHQGCVYIFSWIEHPGVIHEKGNYCQYFWGSQKKNAKLETFFFLAEKAVNKVNYEEDIEKRVWWKFSRISVFATLTTHHNITNGQIKSNSKYLDELRALSEEFFAVAHAMGTLTENQVSQSNLKMIENSPDTATSSMQRDYYAGKHSELDSLTGYISMMGKQLGIATPAYDKAYNDLLPKK